MSVPSSDLNVLLITADQFRADCLSAAGHPLVRTPNLDQLAAEGVRGSRHLSQCPPCGPSRTSLLTGMYQMNHRSVQNGTPLDAGFTNLAETVRQSGREPWLIGYTDTTMDPRRFHHRDPRVQRYEEILPGMLQFAPGSEWGSGDLDWIRHLRELGYRFEGHPHRQRDVGPQTAGRGPSFAPTIYKAEHSDTAYTADRAIRFVHHQGKRPWFLHVSFLRPHPPFIAPEPWHDLYKPEEVPDFVCLPTQAEEERLHPVMPVRLKRIEMDPKLPIGPHPNENMAWRQARATYYGLISELDHHIGRLIAELKAAGVWDRTLLIFTSDHAEMLGDHWAWGKQLPFDKAVHVPLILRAPDMSNAAKGRTIERYTEHVDVMPTILDLLDVEIPIQCDGRSLRPFLEGREPDRWRTEGHWEFDFRDVFDDTVERELGLSIDECSMAAIRDDKRKYVHFAALPPLFFDLETDPGELVNLAHDPARAPEMLDYARRMLSWRAAFNRRELTGIRILDGRLEHAERRRRIA